MRSSKLQWAWRAQFLSHNLQILGKFIFFEDLQMIEKQCLAKSNRIDFGCTCAKLGIQVYWHQILSVLIQNTNNSTFFTCTLGHVKKSGIVDALNLRRLKFEASTSCYLVFIKFQKFSQLKLLNAYF